MSNRRLLQVILPPGKCSCLFQSFGAAVSRSGPPAVRFRDKLSENPIFRCNSLIGSPNCEPSVPASYSTPMGSARVGFGVSALPFPVPDSRRAVFEPKLSESHIFRCNSLTGSPNCEPSVPTCYSTPISFESLAQPFPIPDPRRTVFELNCPKITFFGVILKTVVQIVNVGSYKLFYFHGKCSCRLSSFCETVPRFGPTAGRFRAKLSENHIFRCN